MRSLPFIVSPMLLLIGGCGSSAQYSLSCEDVLGDGSRAEVDCVALVEAVIAEAGDDERISDAAVWAFVGCPPGAYCGLAAPAEPLPEPPVSALIGVRTADGHASLWSVNDVSARPLAPAVTLGYDPDDFIDRLARSAAASRAP